MTVLLGSSVLDTTLFVSELKFKRREAVLREMVERAARHGAVSDPALLEEVLALRERAGGTALGKGIAIPNARALSVRETRLVVGRSARGIDWQAADEAPVHLVLMVLSPPEASEETHLGLVARVAGALRLQRQRQKLLEAESLEAVALALREAAS